MKVKKLVLVLALFMVLFVFSGCDVISDLLGLTEPEIDPLPGTFGLYSEDPDHQVYFDPHFAPQDCTADRTNTGEVTPYDGSYVLKVTFTGGSDGSAWMKFGYDSMDISNSSHLVFALEKNNSASDSFSET